MEIPSGRGFQKPNFFNESTTLKGNFWRGGGFNLKNLPWEEYGYNVFSGTTHYYSSNQPHMFLANFSIGVQ